MDQSNKKIIPNFLGIGAAKCATTWMSELLRKHPDVYIAHGKELVFFSSDKKYSKGISWYLNHFSNVHKEIAIGEFSVSYLGTSELAAQRIFEFNPDMKLIAILRDPVHRAFSHFRWLKQIGKTASSSFINSLEVENNIVNESLYYKKLLPFWNLFDKKNILLIKYEELNDDPMSVQKQVFRFLNVREDFDSGLANKVIGHTISPRSTILEKLRIKIHTLARIYNVQYIITIVKKTGLSGLYRKLNNKTQLGITTDEYLAAIPFFTEDVAKLSSHTGINFSDWLVCSDSGQTNLSTQKNIH